VEDMCYGICVDESDHHAVVPVKWMRGKKIVDTDRCHGALIGPGPAGKTLLNLRLCVAGDSDWRRTCGKMVAETDFLPGNSLYQLSSQ
jgi:hypothetical protein